MKTTLQKICISAVVILMGPVGFGLCVIGFGTKHGLLGLLLIVLGAINVLASVWNKGLGYGPRNRIFFDVLGTSGGLNFFKVLGWGSIVIGLVIILFFG